MSGTIALIWAALAGLPAVVVAVIALAALTLGVVLAHYGLRLREHLRESKQQQEQPSRELSNVPARSARSASAPSNTSPPGRVYGGAAVGAAIRQRAMREEKHAVFVGVEGEIALAREEALEMAKMLRKDWPHITPDGAVVEVCLPDWRSKTLDFIGVVLGAGRRAAFKAAGASGNSALEDLEAEGAFLDTLTSELTPSAIRVSEAQFLASKTERRGHEAASFLHYDHSQGIPKASLAVDQIGDLEFGRRDDRGELAQRCHMLAGSVEKWVEITQQQEGPITAKVAEEWLKEDAELEPAEAVRRAHARYEKTREADYRLKYEGEARKLFREAWELHEVAKEHERLAVQPLAIEFERVPRLFNLIAERLYAGDE